MTAKVNRVTVHIVWASGIPHDNRDPELAEYMARWVLDTGVEGSFKLLVCEHDKGSACRSKTVKFSTELDEKGGIPCRVQQGDNSTCYACSLILIKNYSDEPDDKLLARKQTVLRNLLKAQGDRPQQQTMQQLKAKERKAKTRREQDSQQALLESMNQRLQTSGEAQRQTVGLITEVAEAATQAAQEMTVAEVLLPSYGLDDLVELVGTLEAQLEQRQMLEQEQRRCQMEAKQIAKLEKLPLTAAGKRELEQAKQCRERIPELEADIRKLPSTTALRRRLGIFVPALREWRRLVKE